MTTLLTTQEVQDLLHVDRSTVYRMADDGRLPSVKVGRQWRFPADRIAAQFGTPVPSDTGVEASIAPRAAGERPALSRNDRSGRDEASPLAPDAAQAIANLLADLLGVMTLVSDAHGNPLSDVTNPCGLYAAIAGEQAAADACVAEWRSFAERPQVAQRFSPTHLGFLCARAFVWADGRPVAMLLVGGITPPVWPPPPDRVEELAASLGVPVERMTDAIEQTYDVADDRQRWILDALAQFGDVLSLLLGQQQHLRSTLDAIARLALAESDDRRGGPNVAEGTDSGAGGDPNRTKPAGRHQPTTPTPRTHETDSR